VKENPWNSKKVAGIFSARSRREVEAAFSKIFHYGKYSDVSFDRGIIVFKEIGESERGIGKEVLKQPVAVPVSTLKTFSNVMEQVGE